MRPLTLFSVFYPLHPTTKTVLHPVYLSNHSFQDFLIPGFFNFATPCATMPLETASYYWILPTALFLSLVAMVYIWFRTKRHYNDCRRRAHRKEIQLKQLNKRIDEQEGQLEQKSALLTGLKHVIREPLERLVNHAYDLTEGGSISEKRAASRAIIKDNQHLLKQFLRDIPGLSSLESPRIQTQTEAFDLDYLLKDVYAYAEREKEDQQRNLLEVHLDSPGQLADNRFIQGDRQRIHQLLVLLIRHSVWYTKSGRIDIGCSVEGDFIFFIIQNTGIGFTSSEYAQLFNAFRQGCSMVNHSSVEAHFDMVLAGEIVHRMNGDIWAESSRKGDTRFVLKLPFVYMREGQESKRREQEKSADVLYNWTGKTILVVEDSRMAFDLIAKMFGKTGARFILEPDGQKAVERCKKDASIDVVLMDIQLPVMDGYEATRRIKKMIPDLPVIAQTANAMAGDRKKALEAGCDEYIAKPIDREEMGEKLARFLNRH
jgi:CheY-like chemotaxis protein